MKVLVFTSLYPNNMWPNRGVFVKERMTHFANLEGNEVKVVAPVPYFPPIRIGYWGRFSQVRRHEVIDGLDVYHPRYSIVPKVSMPVHGLLMFLSVLSTIKYIHNHFAFDLIDAHFIYPDGFAAVLLGRFLRKPVFVSARGSDINLFKNLCITRPFLRYTLGRANGVIAVSQALKDSMGHLGIAEEKIVVIPNGVDTQKFSPIPKEEAQKQLGLPRKKTLLSIGSLLALKGFDLLIKAFELLREKYVEEDLALVLIGEGPLRKNLEELIAARNLHADVHLIGAVPHQELPCWYSFADLFCLASSREGWPNVLMESLACGTPVVATAVGGIPEIICSEDLGLLARRNVQSFAETILQALKRTWNPQVLVQYAQTHTWDRAAHTVQQVFMPVLQK